MERNRLRPTGSAGLDRNELKYAAVFFMVLDHTAYAFLPEGSSAYLLLRLLGRLTMPIMAWFLAEGYRYTRDKRAYGLRLLLFSVAAAVPFSYLAAGSWLPAALLPGSSPSPYLHLFLPFAGKTLVIYPANVIFTLFLSFLNLAVWDRTKLPTVGKAAATALICIAASAADWGYWCVLMCFIFWKFRERHAMKWALYALLSVSYIFRFTVFQNPLCVEVTHSFAWFRLGILLAAPVLELLYNGQKGRGSRFDKWFFYAFYPLHLLVIDLILWLT